MERKRTLGDHAVLQRAAHEAGRHHRAAVVGECGGARAESSAISLNSSPSWPLLMAAMNPVGTTASSRARSTSAPSTDAESTTGSVFGIPRIAQ